MNTAAGNPFEPGVYGWQEVTEDGSPPEWVKPGGAPGYGKGAQVSWKGGVCTSTQNGNVWSPDEYPPAWDCVYPGDGDEGPIETVDPSDPDPPPWGVPDPAEWSADMSYAKGERVTFEGRTWTSIFDGPNVWSPADFPDGWKLVTVEE